MKLKIFRTAIIGGGLSYDVYVPVSELTNYQPSRYTTTIRSGEKYISFVDATMPEDHHTMPLGFDRYEHYQRHAAQAKEIELAICKEIFPELRKLSAEVTKLPELWVTGLMTKETSKTFNYEYNKEKL
jgi:hypothetical protein